MSFKNEFVVWVLLFTVAVVVTIYVVLQLRKKGQPARSVLVANTTQLAQKPRFKWRLRDYRFVLVLSSLFVLMTIVLSAFLAARPSEINIQDRDERRRDIVLCLDVSGSMRSNASRALTTFTALTQELEGERISLVLFDSSPVTVFPLTDDYDFINHQLSLVINYNQTGAGEAHRYFSSVNLGRGSSLVADGLGVCAMQFDLEDEERSRTLIIGSDYAVAGQELVSIETVISYIQYRKINLVLFAYPGWDADNSVLGKLQDVFPDYYDLDGSQAQVDQAVARVVNSVLKDEASITRYDPLVSSVDTPEVLIWIVVILSLLSLVLLGRIRR